MSDMFARLVERTHAAPESVKPLSPPIFGVPYQPSGERRERFEEQEAYMVARDIPHPRDHNRETSHDTHNAEPMTSDTVRQILHTSRIVAESKVDAQPERIVATMPTNEVGTTPEGLKRSLRAERSLDVSESSHLSEPLNRPQTLSLSSHMIPMSARSGELRSCPADPRRYTRNNSSDISPRLEQSPARPIVRVTIGRIEVKAVIATTPVVRQSAQSPRHRPMPLAEYLKQRNEGAK